MPARAPRGGHLSAASISIVKLLATSLLHVPVTLAAPYTRNLVHTFEEELPKSPDDGSLWAYLGTAIALVLLGGAFAGLTIALMGQDEIYLQVIATSGEGKEKKDAQKVLRLLKRGKHWVLVTLLLSNVITNETLPIVLDRSLGGGWPAVVSSTVLIVIFGEIAPQSVCVRYGLSIGAWMAPFVLALMWIMAPVAWPTAKLLDWLLGEDHGTTYKKAGLKTLVTLHKSLGSSPTERLNEDEVTIISAVLDLKEKAVGDIMTPMDDVFTMSADTVLDEAMMDTILSQGYSRIPIYAPESPNNFIGMLLVKILITYDPEDALRVRDFALATLPETAPETSCLDIVNFFQEGKSHMVLVSEHPGQDRGALGVLTLEDVIEELIGEEIIDESDVFIDVHRAIRRMAPAPRTRYTKTHGHKESKDAHPTESEVETTDATDAEPVNGTSDHNSRNPSANPPEGPKRGTTFLMRRRSSGADGSIHGGPTVSMRGNSADMKQHLKHLGPSNAASKPRATKYTSVKIKPGVGTIPEAQGTAAESPAKDPQVERESALSALNGRHNGGLNVVLLGEGGDAKSDSAVVSSGYGATDFNPPIRIAEESEIINDELQPESTQSPQSSQTAAQASEQARRNVSSHPSQKSPNLEGGNLQVPTGKSPRTQSAVGSRRGSNDSSTSTIGSLSASRRPSRNRRAARSGSITESTVHVGGMKKLVLETHSSSDNENGETSGNSQTIEPPAPEPSSAPPSKSKKHKKNKKKSKNAKKGGSAETSPLLGNH